MSATESSEDLSLDDFRAKYIEFVSFCKDNCKYYLDQNYVEFLDLRVSFTTLYSFVEKVYNFGTDSNLKIRLSQREGYIDIEYYSPSYYCVIIIGNILDSIRLYIKDCPEENNFRYCDIGPKHSKLFYLTIEERKTDFKYESIRHKDIKYEDPKYTEYFKIIYNLMSKIISIKPPVGSHTKGAIKASSTD
jgi:hypothetical protein